MGKTILSFFADFKRKRIIASIVSTITIFTIFALGLWIQQSQMTIESSNPRHIMFHSKTIDTTRIPNVVGAIQHPPITTQLFSFLCVNCEPSSQQLSSPYLTPTTWLIHVDSILTTDQKKRIEDELGLPLGPYMPHNTYLLVCPETIARRAQELDNILWVGHYPSSVKKSQSLQYLLEHPSNDLSNFTLLVELSPKTDQPWTKQQAQLIAEQWTKYSGESSSVSQLVQSSGEINSLPKKMKTFDKTYKIYFAVVANDIVSVTVNQNKYLNPHSIITSSAILQQVVDWLSIQPDCHVIDFKKRYASTNYYASRIIQSGLVGTDTAYGVKVGKDAGDSTIWDNMNLLGEGQIVGVADTGLDIEHCFFNDPNSEGPGPFHRKIMAYQINAVGDDLDSNGHGTHVVGTLVGNPPDDAPVELKNNKGVAPKAKVVFHDIGQGSELYIPDDLSDMFAFAYRKGARVHSNSWSCADGPTICNTYDLMAKSIDKFVQTHPNMLFIWAAGNDGQSNSKKSTVSSPSTAKNSIAVGASNNPKQSFLDSIEYIDFPARIARAKSAGQLGNDDDCCKVPDDDVKLFCCKSYIESQYGKTDTYKAVNIAPFSSRGPSHDGRLKPEVVASGYTTISAKAGGTKSGEGQCQKSNLVAESGTSMAAPVIAGSALLVREYLAKKKVPRRFEHRKSWQTKCFLNTCFFSQ